MASITGQYLVKYIQQKMGMAYTGYLDPTKWNRLFQDSLLKLIEDRYENKQDQKFKDELYFLLSSNNSLTINNNLFYLRPVPIINVTNVGTTITVTTFVKHNLIATNSVTTSGIAGFATNNPNGIFTVVTTPTPTTFTFVAGSAPTGGPYTDNSGVLVFNGGQLTDYLHLLSIKANMLVPLYTFTTASFSGGGGSPFSISLSNYNNLRSGEQINVVAVSPGPTLTNLGNLYIKSVNSLTIQLYTDSNLQTPFIGAIPGGTTSFNLSRVYYNYCKPYLSDEKNGTLNLPSPINPGYLMADGLINIYPLTTPCPQIQLDYIKRPLDVYGTGLFIDTNDANLSLTDYYPENLIMVLTDKAIEMFGLASRDSTLFSGGNNERKDIP